MNYHIVRTNETIESIALTYNFTVDEIKSINTHIRIWTKLIPGTKIRLPEISDAVNNELTDVEPFIEDYYPKINLESLKSEVYENETVIPISNPVNNSEEQKHGNNDQQPVKTTKPSVPKYPNYYSYPNYQYGYYGYPAYPYQYYPTTRLTYPTRPTKTAPKR